MTLPKTKKSRRPPKDATLSQREAYTALLPFCTNRENEHAVHVLSGYAGTGKTWLAVHLIQAACDKGLRVAVCAPTHKAVSVITAKLDGSRNPKLWTGTLHALLGLKLRETHEGVMRIELDRHPKATYFESYDIVFVDEASMVGPALLSYIERFIRGARTRVLYLGDPGQLLPIESREPVSDTRQGDWVEESTENGVAVPPVFTLVPTHHRLTEIVRQRSTGKPHPIVQFAQEIRRYIEGDIPGVFDPEAVRRYLTDQAQDMSVVRIARAEHIAEGAVALRRRRPAKDIRVIAWRNRVVDARNLLIHRGLASLYSGDTAEADARAPFWPGETLVAREALYGFRPTARICERDAKIWEQALAPFEENASVDPANSSRQEPAADLVPNNTEMTVRACEPTQHPYLDIASWRIEASITGQDTVEFFVADNTQEYQRLVRKTWDDYRTVQNRSAEGFRRAWARTRACAPVMHSYAMTAHKAQGSTFHYALVDLADLYGLASAGSAEEYHRALYVAVTRATERVWLCL